MAADAQRDPAADKVVDRDRAGLFVRHRQIEIDRLAGQPDARPQLGHVREPRRLTGFGDERRHQRVGAAFYVVDELVQYARPIRGGQIGPRPLIEAAPGLGNGSLDLCERCDRDVVDVGLVRWVLDGDHFVAGDPRSTDERPPLRENRHAPSSLSLNTDVTVEHDSRFCHLEVLIWSVYSSRHCKYEISVTS